MTSVASALLVAVTLSLKSASDYKYIKPLCTNLITGVGLSGDSLRYDDAMFLREAFKERSYLKRLADSDHYPYTNYISSLSGVYDSTFAARYMMYISLSTNSLIEGVVSMPWPEYEWEAARRAFKDMTVPFSTPTYTNTLAVLGAGAPLNRQVIAVLYDDLKPINAIIQENSVLMRGDEQRLSIISSDPSSFAYGYTDYNGFDYYSSYVSTNSTLNTNEWHGAETAYSIRIKVEKEGYTGFEYDDEAGWQIADQGNGTLVDTTESFTDGGANATYIGAFFGSLTNGCSVLATYAFLWGWYRHQVWEKGESVSDTGTSFLFPVDSIWGGGLKDPWGEYIVSIKDFSHQDLFNAGLKAANDTKITVNSVGDKVRMPEPPPLHEYDIDPSFGSEHDNREEAQSVELRGGVVILELQFNARQL